MRRGLSHVRMRAVRTSLGVRRDGMKCLPGLLRCLAGTSSTPVLRIQHKGTRDGKDTSIASDTAPSSLGRDPSRHTILVVRDSAVCSRRWEMSQPLKVWIGHSSEAERGTYYAVAPRASAAKSKALSIALLWPVTAFPISHQQLSQWGRAILGRPPTAGTQHRTSLRYVNANTCCAFWGRGLSL
jgi:hypothetical protein